MKTILDDRPLFISFYVHFMKEVNENNTYLLIKLFSISFHKCAMFKQNNATN